MAMQCYNSLPTYFFGVGCGLGAAVIYYLIATWKG